MRIQTASRSNFNPRSTIYTFIDGAYLDKVIEDISENIFGLPELTLNTDSYRFNESKTFYYHALPGKKRGESKSQFETRIEQKEKYFNELKLRPNFHVYEGVTYGRDKKLRQKTVDIKLALDMLKHTAKRNMDCANLVTGDLDFKPLLDELLNDGMVTNLIYSPRSVSEELLYSADILKPIKVLTIWKWTTDDIKKQYTYPSGTQKIQENLSNFERTNILVNNKNASLINTDIKGKEAIIEISNQSSGLYSYYFSTDPHFLINCLRYDFDFEITE